MTEFNFYLTYPDRWALEDARFDLGNHAGNVIAETETDRKKETLEQQ